MTPLVLAALLAAGGGGETPPLVVRAGAALEAVVVYPNPFRPNDGLDRTGTEASGIVFASLPPGTRLEIFTPRGERVWSADSPRGGDLRWRAETHRGRPVANGLYLWVATSGTHRRTGRLSILR